VLKKITIEFCEKKISKNISLSKLGVEVRKFYVQKREPELTKFLHGVGITQF